MINLCEIVQEYFNEIASKKEYEDDLTRIFSMQIGNMTSLVNIGLNINKFENFIRNEYEFNIKDEEMIILQTSVYVGWLQLNDYKVINLFIESDYFSYSIPYYKNLLV